MRELAFRAPPALPVAQNATTPTGLLGAEIWSTTANKKLVWDGSRWAPCDNLVVSATQPTNPSLNQLWLDIS